jgi:hypothetical protein
LKPKDFWPVVTCELHHFCDASEIGYGSVAYVNQINQAGKIHCMIVFAKSKLSPLQQVTIPRLELLAAVEAVKVDQLLKREFEIPLGQSTFWSET